MDRDLKACLDKPLRSIDDVIAIIRLQNRLIEQNFQTIEKANSALHQLQIDNWRSCNNILESDLPYL